MRKKQLRKYVAGLAIAGLVAGAAAPITHAAQGTGCGAKAGAPMSGCSANATKTKAGSGCAATGCSANKTKKE